ncbi:MAG: hypothetical protein K2I27_11495, partial [Bacteroides sp.]|nr:hypothetical protein [Bacteroides sp.]
EIYLHPVGMGRLFQCHFHACGQLGYKINFPKHSLLCNERKECKPWGRCLQVYYDSFLKKEHSFFRKDLAQSLF